MKQLWQLKRISTNEALTEPQLLPDNWGPIFGLKGFLDKLNDLSWVGLEDQGWFLVEEIDDTAEQLALKEAEVKIQRNKLLWESDWTVLPDVVLTAEEKAAWLEYRQNLRDIQLQPGYPYSVEWPAPVVERYDHKRT